MANGRRAHGELGGRSTPSRHGPRTLRPPPTLSCHTGDAESSSFRTGDEDEQALNLLDIVEPLQQPLSVLQKERRVALASPSLVVSDKMLQVESTDRHPETSQKLPMSNLDPDFTRKITYYIQTLFYTAFNVQRIENGVIILYTKLAFIIKMTIFKITAILKRIHTMDMRMKFTTRNLQRAKKNN